VTRAPCCACCCCCVTWRGASSERGLLDASPCLCACCRREAPCRAFMRRVHVTSWSRCPRLNKHTCTCLLPCHNALPAPPRTATCTAAASCTATSTRATCSWPAAPPRRSRWPPSWRTWACRAASSSTARTTRRARCASLHAGAPWGASTHTRHTMTCARAHTRACMHVHVSLPGQAGGPRVLRVLMPACWVWLHPPHSLHTGWHDVCDAARAAQVGAAELRDRHLLLCHHE
jgi:hypothetical protein